MKNKILLIGLIVLIVGTVFAGIGLIRKDKTVTLSKEAEQYYKDLNITPSYEDYEQEGVIWRCLTSNTKFNLPCSRRFNSTIYNESTLDQWQNERLEGIAQVQISRKNMPVKETIRKGNITISK